MEDFNDDTEQTIESTTEPFEASNNEGPEETAIVSGKMARWTEEELTFLADQKALGKGRKDCIKAYFEKFGDRRSEASVSLKVPTTSRASAGPTRPANYPKATRDVGTRPSPTSVVTTKVEEVSAEPTLTPFMQSMSHFMESFATTSKAMTNARGSLKGKDLDTYQSVTKHYLLTLVT